MRIRTVKPEFWAHPVLGRQPADTQLLALALLNYSDDEGHFYADPSLVRSALRPFDDDSSNVRRFLAQLEKCGWIEICEHPSHGLIGRVVNFTKHQKIDRPKASSIKAYWAFDDESTTARRIFDDESLLEGKGMEQGTGKVKEQGSRSADKRPPVTVLIPEELKAIHGFDESWKQFQDHRKKLKKPMTNRAEELILSTLAQQPLRSIEAINLAIRKGWPDIYWDSLNRTKTGQQPLTSTGDTEAWTQ